MKDNTWIHHEALKNIDERKLAIIVDLMNESEGKGIDQALPSLMAANAKLKSMDLSFTPDETNLILDFLTKDMSQNQKNKFAAMRKMVDDRMKKQSKS